MSGFEGIVDPLDSCFMTSIADLTTIIMISNLCRENTLYSLVHYNFQLTVEFVVITRNVMYSSIKLRNKL